MQIEIGGEVVNIDIRRSRRSRRLRLAIHPRGEITLTAPFSMSDERLTPLAQKFVLEKGEWLLQAVEQFKTYEKKIAHMPWLKKKTEVEIKKEYLAQRMHCKKMVSERLAYFNQFYNFKIGAITIRNQKSRWGSCSRRGNLNFNYRLALVPLELADYVVVHELCHIGQMNHSKKFWDLVAHTIPDYKEKRKKLRGDFNLM